jgi:transcriptional regulator with XRE-family HTH domain
MVDFGNVLKKLRQQEGLTQQQLANKLGVTKSVISYYELQERYPSPDVLTKLAQIFHVSTDYLLGIEKGEVIDRPLIGVSTYDTTNTLLTSNTDGGIVVGSVLNGSDAEAAGIEQGDIITKFDGTKVKSSAHLKFLL